jgi:O-antigen ligase
MSPLLLAAVPAVLATLLWAIADLERFVLFVVLAAMVYPASLAQPAGTNIAAVDLLLLVALASWLINNSLRNAPNPDLRNNPLLFPALLVVVVNWISLLWTVRSRSTIAFGVQLTEFLIVFPVVFGSLPRSRGTVRVGLMVLIAVTCVMAAALLLTFATHSRAQEVGTYLPGLNKNAAGSFEAAGLVLAYVLQTSSTGLIRRLLLVALVLDAGGLVASGSRGAMLGAAGAVLVVSIFLHRGKIVAVALVTMLAALYLAIIAPGIAQKTTANGSYDTSVARVHIWKNAVKKIERRPILGTGGGTYEDTQYGQGDPNNLFLLTWAEEGLPGLAALIVLLVSFIRLLARARRLQNHDDAVLSLAAGAVVISLFLHFQVDVSWTRGATSLAFAMMGLMVALARFSSLEPSATRDRETGLRVVTSADGLVPAGSV